MRLSKAGSVFSLGTALGFVLIQGLLCPVPISGQKIISGDIRDKHNRNQAPRSATDSLIINDSVLLKDVVVTAGRTRQNIWEVPQKIERISQQDIDMTPALDATDLIKKSTAINVIQYPGILSGVGFRGFRPDYSGLNQHTLLLIDGRPAGATNLGTIDLNFVDHVEILKGPASALYGSQAMGGVINVLTPQSTGNIKGKVFGDYGSFNTYKMGGQAGGSITPKLDFDAGLVYFKRASDYRMGKGNLFRKALGSGTSMNRYPDGHDSLVNDKRGDGSIRPNTKYSYYTSSARLGYKVSDHWRLDLRGSFFNAHDVESPGDIFSGEAGAGLKNIHRNNVELSTAGTAGIHSLSAKVYYAEEKSTSFAVRNSEGDIIDSPFISAINTYRWYGAQLRDAIRIARQQLIFGYDFNRASSQNSSFKAPVSGYQQPYASAPNAAILTNGIYIQGQLSLFDGKVLVNPGIRTDITKFEVFQTPGYTKKLTTGGTSNIFTSPSFSAQWNITKDLGLHGSIGRAFITPDAYEVAGDQSEGNGSGKISLSEGNPDLKNESSVGEDLGIKYRKRGFEGDVTFFNTDVKNRIAAVSAPPATPDTIGGDVVTSVTHYYNANKSKMRGWEVTAAYNFGALADYAYLLRIFMNMTYTPVAKDLTNTGGMEAESSIQNVAKTVLNYGLEYGKGKISARLTGRYMGRRWDTDYNDPLRPQVYYPSFMTLDAVVNYHFLPKHQLSFSMSNITDENYYEKRGYNMPGRAIDIGYTFLFGK